MSGPAARGEAGATANGGVRRREFVVGGSGLTAGALLALIDARHEATQRLFTALAGSESMTVKLTRPDDFVAIVLKLYNLQLRGPGQSGPGDPLRARLIRIIPGSAFVVAEFEPQSILEQSFKEANSTSDTLPTPPVDARLSGRSRLAFRIPDTQAAINFDDASLLDWTGWDPSLAPNAQQHAVNPVAPAAPAETQTAIEYPWQIFISPVYTKSAWVNRTTPKTVGGRTELWHTRLGWYDLDADTPTIREDPDVGGVHAIRAIWTPRFDQGRPGVAEVPFTTSIKPAQRWEIVKSSSDFSAGYTPESVPVRRLMLTSLGATADLRGDFAKKPNINLLHWSHRGTLGRDHFVRIVDAGYLFPFGHAVAKIAITERKIQRIESGEQEGRYGAFLRTREFIVVREPRLTLNSRRFPFKSIELLTLVTPDLDRFDDKASPETFVPNGSSGPFYEKAFWPQVNGTDVIWNVVATDAEGRQSEFSTPLIFVLSTVGDSTLDATKVMLAYNNKTKADRRRRDLGGQTVAYAPPSGPNEGDTSFETRSVDLAAEIFTQAGRKFRPALRQAEIKLPALEAVTPEPYTTVKPAASYVANGFNETANKAQAYLETVEETALSFADSVAGDVAGGIGQANMAIGGISRSLGPLPAIAGAAGLPTSLPNFKPADLLGEAKLLGVEIVQLLAEAIDFPLPSASDVEYANQLAKLPSTVTKEVKDAVDSLPREIRTESNWEPELKEKPFFLPEGRTGKPAKMRLHTLSVLPIDPTGLSVGEPSYEVNGELSNFQIRLAGSDPFLIVQFRRVHFDMRKGQKPKVDVDIDDVVFAGPLAFVNELRKFLSSTGNGLTIDLAPAGVYAGYTLEVPTIATGVFLLKNLSFTGEVSIPFDDRRVGARFAFCRADQPFLLTYSAFGGGGYAEIEVTPDGVESLSMALEYGGATSVDFVVASGSVEVMGGVYFEMSGATVLKLTAYIRLSGTLKVMGAISASLEFNLSLTYDGIKNELWGRATLTVEVDVLLFSGSVEITCEKRLAGGSSSASGARALQSGRTPQAGGECDDPSAISFAERMPEEIWRNEYTTAFAGAAF